MSSLRRVQVELHVKRNDYCVVSVDLGFENLRERMEDGGENIEGVLQDVPSNEEVGQNQGLTLTSNEVMTRYRSIQALYKANNMIKEECLISFEEPTAIPRPLKKKHEGKLWRRRLHPSRRMKCGS